MRFFFILFHSYDYSQTPLNMFVSLEYKVWIVSLDFKVLIQNF